MNSSWQKAVARLAGQKTSQDIAESLAGPQALAGFLAARGYAGQAGGLGQRLIAELSDALPLGIGPAALRLFARHFDRPGRLAHARQEAEVRVPDPPAGGWPAASQVELTPEEAVALWPLASGQAVARLARGYLLTGEPELLVGLDRQLSGFCRAHPPLLGPAWRQRDANATRALNWLWALRFLDDASRLEEATWGPVALHLELLGQFLAQHLRGQEQPSLDDAAAAGALVFLGHCLPSYPEAAAWLDLGLARLGPALVSWSGDTGSARPGQLAAACQWGGLVAWLAGVKGLNSPGLLGGLPRLASFCRQAALPWGVLPPWGWTVASGVLDFAPGETPPTVLAANLAAVVLGDPGLRAAREMDEALFWTVGATASESLRSLAGGPAPVSTDAPALGVTSLLGQGRGRKVALWLRSGPRGTSRRGNEDVGQALALALCLDGAEVFCAPAPTGQGPLAPHLGSRAAQNCLLLDGGLAAQGRVELEALELMGRRLFCAARFRGLDPEDTPVFLRRRVLLDLEAGLLTLVDQVRVSGQHQAEVVFHLPPEVEVMARASACHLSGPWGRAVLHPEPRSQVRLEKGNTHPAQGWHAARPGLVVAAPAICCRASFSDQARLTTVLQWAPA